QASLLIPGILKNLSNKKLKILQKIGENIGVLFQITDDLIDYTSGQDKDKLSYPKIFSVKNTRIKIKKILKQTDDFITKHFPKTNFEYLRFLVHKIASRTN
ncbi:MAG: polyprenyl synthetase family protein, partial [Endomicrobiia bacterium]